MKTVGDTRVTNHPPVSQEPGDPPATEREPDAQGSARVAMRILIVSSVRLLRDGLAIMLERRPRVESVRLACSADDAMAMLREFTPTVILLDVSAADGVAGARRIAARVDGVQVIGFAAGERDHDVLSYAAAGIAAFISRDASAEDLFAAVDRAANGELLCSPRVAGTMFRNLATLSTLARMAPNAAEAALTGREREIVRCIDEGMSNKEIARLLRIGVSTVKNHVHSILEKLHVSRRSEAAARLRGAALRERTAQIEI
jgi:two-component system, NarL family, nitrate/nitrite response regulator NarL